MDVIDKKLDLRKRYNEKMGDLRVTYWEAAEELLEEFCSGDPKLRKKFDKEKEALLNGGSEFYYAYVYEPYYVISDLMGWKYEELMSWIDKNIDKINQICREAYKNDWEDLKRRKK